MRQVVGQRALLALYQRLPTAADDIRARHRFHIAVLVQQVRTKEGALCFFKKQPRLPAMRHMGSLKKSKAILAGAQGLTVDHAFGRTEGHEIIDADEFPHQTADRRRARREHLPFTQASAFVRLQMTEADPPKL